LPDQDVENVRLDWQDLERTGILGALPQGFANTPVHERIANALPAIGLRFVDFVQAEEYAELSPPV
jgi:hypothetical protein